MRDAALDRRIEFRPGIACDAAVRGRFSRCGGSSPQATKKAAEAAFS
jgi:hypothetical protein